MHTKTQLVTDRTCSCLAGRGGQADVCNYVSLFIHFLLLRRASVCTLYSGICLKPLTTLNFDHFRHEDVVVPVCNFIHHSESDSKMNYYHLIRLSRQ